MQFPFSLPQLFAVNPMFDARSWASLFVLAALCAWLGRSVLDPLMARSRGTARTGCERDQNSCARPLVSLAESLAAGLLLLHLWMLALDHLRVTWTPITLLLGPLALLLVVHRVTSVRLQASPIERSSPQIEPWGWGEWVALGCVGLFGWSAWTQRSVAPDFIFHWGVKGRRFFELGGVDWRFLERPEFSYIHPDYPLMVPNSTAALALLAGSWNEAILMLWSVLLFGILVLEIRRVLVDGGLDRESVQWSLAIVVAPLCGFSMAHLQAGAADIPFALALIAISRALWRIDRDLSAPMRLGLWVAFAVATKIEGLPLASSALLLAAIRLAPRMRRELAAGRHGVVAWCSTALLAPLLLVGGWWWYQVLSRGLLQPSNTGLPNAERLRLTLETLPQALSMSSWVGMAWLILLLPLLALPSRWRWFGAVSCFQLAFYLATYIGGDQDTAFWVLSSFPRLLFHLMPVVLVLCCFWLYHGRSHGSLESGIRAEASSS